jgi:tetratricopeptide (TPR) repeat protein
MNELLGALDRDPRRRRVLVGSAAVLAGLGALTWLTVRREDPCAGAERALAEVWSPSRRDQLAQRFTATGLPYAADAAASVSRRLDAYGAAWTEARAQACSAAQADPQVDAPEDVPSARCVERRRRDLGALVDVLIDADAALVERASEALGGLRSLETCFNPALGFGDVPLPADADAREVVESMRDELGRVNAFALAGRRHEALELATEVHGEAVRLGDVALLAESALMYGAALADQGRFDEGVAQLEAGAISAIQSGYDLALLDLWISLAWHAGVDLGRYEVASAWARQADALLVRLGRPLRQLGNLRAAQSAMAAVAGRPEEAVATGRESLEVRMRDQPGEPILANTLLEIANPLVSLGRYDEADEVLRQALAIAIETDGPDHPIVSAIENTMGVRAHFAGDAQTAEVHWRRAYAIMEAALGPDHPELFYSLGNLSEAMREQGKFDEALVMLQRVAALQRSLPPIHREHATTLHNIAGVQLRRGELEAARAGFDEALRIREAVFGPDDPAVANTLTELSDVLLELGRAAEARPLLERAQIIRDATPSSALQVAYTQVMLGRARIATGDASGRALVETADAALAELRGNTRDRLRRIAADVLGSRP